MMTRARTVVLLVLLLLTGATACGDAGTVITRLAVGDPGPDAYTSVAGTDRDDVSRLAAAGGDKEGDAPGLYGGTREDKVCDKDGLVDFLESDPAKAAAWASAQGISPDGIPGFVADLTPVLLRADTLVTNHGYRDGKATKMPAVLQAGIAVMVNARGLPVVKCNCGNPLSAPDPDVSADDGEFKGASWPQFSPDKVTVVLPPDKDVEDLKLVEPDGGAAFDRPVGTDGAADGDPEPVPPAAASEPPVTPTGPQTPPDGTGDGTPTEEPPGTDDPQSPSGTPTADPEPEPTLPGGAGGTSTGAEDTDKDETGGAEPDPDGQAVAPPGTGQPEPEPPPQEQPPAPSGPADATEETTPPEPDPEPEGSAPGPTV